MRGYGIFHNPTQATIFLQSQITHNYFSSAQSTFLPVSASAAATALRAQVGLPN
jgi:hypothetical protein